MLVFTFEIKVSTVSFAVHLLPNRPMDAFSKNVLHNYTILLHLRQLQFKNGNEERRISTSPLNSYYCFNILLVCTSLKKWTLPIWLLIASLNIWFCRMPQWVSTPLLENLKDRNMKIIIIQQSVTIIKWQLYLLLCACSVLGYQRINLIFIDQKSTIPVSSMFNLFINFIAMLPSVISC